MADELRKVEVLVGDTFVEIHFSELKKGDTFRMFEPDGSPTVNENNGDTIFKAMSDVIIGENGFPHIVIA